LVCRWPLGYGIAWYEVALQRLADMVLYLCKGGAAYTNDEYAFPFSYHRLRLSRKAQKGATTGPFGAHVFVCSKSTDYTNQKSLNGLSTLLVIIVLSEYTTALKASVFIFKNDSLALRNYFLTPFQHTFYSRAYGVPHEVTTSSSSTDICLVKFYQNLCDDWDKFRRINAS
jgi:hypothetical protein